MSISPITTWPKTGISEFADKILVISVGMPAERLVIEACSEIHLNVP